MKKWVKTGHYCLKKDACAQRQLQLFSPRHSAPLAVDRANLNINAVDPPVPACVQLRAQIESC